MNRNQLIALAATLAAAGAGIYRYTTSTQALDQQWPPGAFEIFDRDSCSVATCNAPLCQQADAVLADAGSSCSSRLVTCDARIGQSARDWLADAGLPALGPSRYQRIRFVGLRCAAIDGGSAFAVPMDDNGLPQFMSAAQVTPLCVRAPVDGGTACLRDRGDGDGGKFFGAGNVFPAGQAAGANCDQVNCTVVYGDDPDKDL
jgi:hypothetical protein